MIKNYLLKTVNKYVKEYFENIDDIEYGLLKGEVKMKNTFFKEDALKKFTSLLLKKSKIEEIDVKYNWSLFGEATVFVKLQNVLLNLHPGGTIETSYEKTPGLDIKNININMDIHNLVVNFDEFTFKISHLTFITSELISRKAVKVKGITLYLNDKKVLYIPSIEGDVSFNEIIKLCVFIRMIRFEIDVNAFESMLKYGNLILNGNYFPIKEPKRKNKINLICNIRSILIDFTDIRKRIYFNTASLALTNKFGFWIERVRGFDVRYKSRFKSKVKHFKPKKMLEIDSFSLDKKIYTFKHCFLDHRLIVSLDPYYKIIQSCQMPSKTENDDKSTFLIKDLKILVDSNEILISNCLLELYIHKSSFKTKLCVDSLLLDDFLKAESLKIDFENNKIYSEALNIFLNLEELNLKRAYRSYLKYCVGEGSLDVYIMSHLSNLKIVYGPKTKLIEVYNIIIEYNLSNNSDRIPLISVESGSRCFFEVFNYKNNTVCCLSDLDFDLKVLKKFNNDFLLPRENDINHIIKHFKSIRKTNECNPCIYLYNVNVVYEELRLNIEFFEFNSIFNTIFTVFLDDGNHIIVDSAKVKLLIGDILQVQITNNLRINITNSILKKVNKLFLDLKNIIILSIKEDEDSITSISWILDLESISVNIFDINLNEILAIYLFKTKICNVKEYDGDETVRKLYLKINDIQIDNQVMKNTYPVLLYKTKSNDIIEGNLLYYYNNSTLFIKKTDVKFEEMRLNIEGKHIQKVLEVFKVENVESTSLKTNVESFMNTFVTVKDFHIGDLNVKINYLMKNGDNLRDKMLFFVLNMSWIPIYGLSSYGK